MSQPKTIRLRRLGVRDYEPVWREMQRFTDDRSADTEDEIWLLQHPPIFTLGRNATEEHLLNPGEIPVLRVDRGGQVTYHGPGQLMLYLLFDLRRAMYAHLQVVSLSFMDRTEVGRLMSRLQGDVYAFRIETFSRS